MDGLILVHKPAGMTSHDVVVRIRQTVRQKKVGHFGTLDPWATGLLIIALGKATRLFPFFLDSFKTYRATIKLGMATDTYDFTGKPLLPETRHYPGKESLLKAMVDFEGEIDQVPPLYSAKKYRGRPLYILARKNQKIEPRPCRVVVKTFAMKHFAPPFVECLVRCSSGTYIRSLAHDLGQKLGCGAHLVQLERTSIEPYGLEDSFSLNDIQKKVNEEKLHEVLIPIESLLNHLTKIVVTNSGRQLVNNGNPVYQEHILSLHNPEETKDLSRSDPKDLFRLFSPDGRLLAIARRDDEKNCLHPFLVIDSDNPGK